VEGERESVIAEMREGVRFVSSDVALSQLSIFAFAGAFFGVPLITLLPVVARDVLGLGAAGYSSLLTAYGAGSVLGALIVAATGHSKHKGRIALSLQMVYGVALFLFAFSRSRIATTLLAFVAGAALIAVIATISSLVQLAAEEKVRGRVMSIFLVAFRGGMPLGNLFSGFIAERASIATALVINAVAMTLFAGQAFLRRLRITRL
jgi:predicted MFS family arabinose efflux permease